MFLGGIILFRTNSLLDNTGPQHISVLKSLSVKAAVDGPVVCFALATFIGAMDVLLSACQCPVCLSHSLGTQSKLHLASGICLELYLLSYFGDSIAV